MPPRATPFFTHPYKCPGCMGVSVHILKVSLYLFPSRRSLSTLFSFPAQESSRFSSFVFKSLRTLSFSVSCKSFACHSYENCRVYTNNSHSGTLQTFRHSHVPPWLACPQNVCEDYGFRSNLWSETFTTSSI